MVDIILFNANVLTLDDQLPTAKMITINKGKIQNVSVENNFKAFKEKNSIIIDCKGRTVLPGFIDAHFHFNAFAESFLTLDLSPKNNIQSIADIQSAIRKHIDHLPPNCWVRARGYNEFYLEERRHPNRWDLDAVTASLPIKLTHRSGHAHVLNSEALKCVGISRETPDPSGGLIERSIPSGEPTGVLYEMGGFLSRRIPPISSRRLAEAAKQADRQLARWGITSIQDASFLNSEKQWERFSSFIQNGILHCRVRMMLGLEGFRAYQANPFLHRVRRKQLHIGCVKIILDETTGELHPTQSEVNKLAQQIHQKGCQMAIHAVEESAIHSACTAVEYALNESNRPGHRHRIEHCSICPPLLAERIASLGIMIVTQPSFLYFNGERYLQTVPDHKLNYLYPLKTLSRKKVKVVGSSDCPIVSPNPLIGIYSAVTRSCDTGDVIKDTEKMDIIEAIKLYTRYGAESSFEETMKGTITQGKVADIIMLNGDPTRLSPSELKDLKVNMTIGNGRILYKSIEV
jgi:predicted amidohydrolase YtcJ